MKKVLKSQVALLFLSALAARCPALLHAQQYLYTNDHIQYNSGNNTVTAYKVSAKGAVIKTTSQISRQSHPRRAFLFGSQLSEFR